MKKWARAVAGRLGDLVVKMLGMKVVIAAGLTAVLVAKPDLGMSPGFLVVLLMWMVVFGLRDLKEAKRIGKGIMPMRGIE